MARRIEWTTQPSFASALSKYTDHASTKEPKVYACRHAQTIDNFVTLDQTGSTGVHPGQRLADFGTIGSSLLNEGHRANH